MITMEYRIRKLVLGLYQDHPRRKVDEYGNNDELVVVKPLEWITTNDIYDLTQILIISHMDSFDDQKEFILQLYNVRPGTQWDMGHTAFDILKASDLLRARGYAIPAFGYTVQELVDNRIFDYLVLETPQDSRIDCQSVKAGDMKRKGNKSKGLEALLKKK